MRIRNADSDIVFRHNFSKVVARRRFPDDDVLSQPFNINGAYCRDYRIDYYMHFVAAIASISYR